MESPVKEEAVRERNFRVPYWLMWTAVLGVLLLICIGIYAALKPDQGERLTAHHWCVLELKYEGKPVEVKSTGLVTRYGDGCNEQVSFYGNHIHLPGVNSFATEGLFGVADGKLKIEHCYSLGDLYNGDYTITADGNDCLILESKHTWMKVQLTRGILGY